MTTRTCFAEVKEQDEIDEEEVKNITTDKPKIVKNFVCSKRGNLGVARRRLHRALLSLTMYVLRCAVNKCNGLS